MIVIVASKSNEKNVVASDRDQLLKTSSMSLLWANDITLCVNIPEQPFKVHKKTIFYAVYFCLDILLKYSGPPRYIAVHFLQSCRFFQCYFA